MHRHGSLVALLVASLFLVTLACTEPTEVALSGHYEGSITTLGTAGATSRLIMTLSQQADRVTGSWTTTSITGHFSAESPSGTVSGTISRDSVSITLNITTPCAGAWAGSARALSGGARLSGSVTGSLCDVASERAFLVER